MIRLWRRVDTVWTPLCGHRCVDTAVWTYLIYTGTGVLKVVCYGYCDRYISVTSTVSDLEIKVSYKYKVPSTNEYLFVSDFESKILEEQWQYFSI